jgi:hypothetical protein
MPRKSKKTADDYTRAELYARAEKKGIKYRSRMNKQQLFEALGLGTAARARKKPAPARKTAPKAARKKAAARSRSASKRSAAGRAAGRKAPAESKAPAARRAVPAAKKPATRKPAPEKPAAKRAAARAAKPAEAAKRPSRPAAQELRPAVADPGALPASSVVPPPPPAPAAAAYMDRGPALPSGYGDDHIVALVRDPRCIFVYWELGGGGYERAKQEFGDEMAGGVWVLRLVKVLGERFFDVPVDPATGNWYLHVEPAERYLVKIGVVLASGLFREIAVSGEVVTPAETVSDVVDEEWMLVRDEFDRLVEEILSARTPGGVGSSEILHRLLGIPRRIELFSGAITSPRGGR